MDGDPENSDDINVKEMFELQLSEIEMLQSMFPDSREFKLDDEASVINIKAFLHGDIKYEYLYDRIGFTVNLQLEESKVSYSFLASGDFCRFLTGCTQIRIHISSDLNPIKLFDTLIVFLKEYFEKFNFEKSQQRTTKACEITQHANSIVIITSPDKQNN